MTSFDKLVNDIYNVLAKGRLQEDHVNVDYRELILHGIRSRGACYRVMKRLKNRLNFIYISQPDQTLPKESQYSPSHQHVLVLDMGNFGEHLAHFREIAEKRKDMRLMIAADEEGNLKGSQKSFSVAADYYLSGFEKDIDPPIAEMTAALYLNVDGAVIFGKDKPYLQTAFLIEYPRSRDMLEGILSSVVRKFSPQVLASREIVGVPDVTDVRMYELTETIAKKLGLESAMIEKNGEGEYAVRGDIADKRVLPLDDVVGTGNTIVKIVRTIRKAGGIVKHCVALFDREEGAASKLAENDAELYALTNAHYL